MRRNLSFFQSDVGEEGQESGFTFRIDRLRKIQGDKIYFGVGRESKWDIAVQQQKRLRRRRVDPDR